MKTVVIAGQIHPDGLALFDSEPDLSYDLYPDPAGQLTPEILGAADALLVRYGVLSERVAAGMERLKVVSRHGVGCDNLPVDYLAGRGIPVTIVGAVNAVSVAEQVMAMLMALLRKIILYDRATRQGEWDIRESQAVGNLAGRRLLLLGLGRIGGEVARRAKAFDMVVDAFDPFLGAEEIRASGYTPVRDWRAALPEADALSLHLPLSAETRNLIDADALAAMKPTAILINAARGGLVDEAALHNALTGRMRQGGAALDCFETEPVDPSHPLLTLPNVIVSPHSAALSAETAQQMGVIAARNVIAGLNGALDPDLIFNRRQLEEAGHGT